MGDKSAIEWTEATWNPVVGCSKVSPGCAHCYAESIAKRFGDGDRFPTFKPWTPENAEHNVVLKPDRLDQPLRWRRPRMVFVNSMSDLFHELVPDEYLAKVFGTIAGTPQHTYQILTKRPERARAWFEIAGAGIAYDRRHGSLPDEFHEWPLPNVWLGVSIENARYTWRADVLREIPAAIRFISAEPLLGSLFEEGRSAERRGGGRGGVPRDSLDLAGIDWLIVGGESGGRHARPMHPEWARELRDAVLAHRECLICEGEDPECHRRVAFFFKQWGSWVPYEEDPQPPFWNGQDGRTVDGHWFPPGLADHKPLTSRPPGPQATWYWPERLVDGSAVYRYAGASPKSGGRLLDGRVWNEIPALREADAA